MVEITTDIIVIGSHSVGPFAVRRWNAHHTLALIANPRREWVPTAMAHGEPVREPSGGIRLPSSLSPAQELVLLVAATAVHSPDVLSALTEAGFIGPSPLHDEGPRIYVPVDDLDAMTIDPALIDLAVRETVDVVRLGRVQLDPRSELDDDNILWLRVQGFDVEEFRPVPVGAPQP